MNPYAKQLDFKRRHQRVFHSLDIQVQSAIAGREEGLDLDFKAYGAYTTKGKSRDRAREDFLDDVVALANADGGRIIIGVEENDKPPHTVTGIPEEKLPQLKQRLRSMAQDHLLPDSRCLYIRECAVFGKNLLVIDVYQCKSGPAYYEKNNGHIFKIREGESNRNARLDELQALLRSRPLPIARQQAKYLASQFVDASSSSKRLHGIFIPEQSLMGSKIEGIAKSRFRNSSLISTGFSVFAMTHPDLLDFSMKDQDSIPWPIGSCVRLNDDLKPIYIHYPGYNAILSYWSTDYEYCNAFQELSEKAGELIIRHGKELFAVSGFWSGIDSKTLESATHAWLQVLVHWQFSNQPVYIWEDCFDGNMKSVLERMDMINEKGFIDPKVDKFWLPLSEDLYRLSARLLEMVSY